MFTFFFFKQKTAYEMRISDWSSDVCSSDLAVLAAAQAVFGHGFEYAIGFGRGAAERDHHDDVARAHRFAHPFEGAALERKPFAIAVVIIARRAPESERSEEHTSELQSLMRISYAVFCLKKQIST